jgi:hypothetical protein
VVAVREHLEGLQDRLDGAAGLRDVDVAVHGRPHGLVGRREQVPGVLEFAGVRLSVRGPRNRITEDAPSTRRTSQSSGATCTRSRAVPERGRWRSTGTWAAVNTYRIPSTTSRRIHQPSADRAVHQRFSTLGGQKREPSSAPPKSESEVGALSAIRRFGDSAIDGHGVSCDGSRGEVDSVREDCLLRWLDPADADKCVGLPVVATHVVLEDTVGRSVCWQHAEECLVGGDRAMGYAVCFGTPAAEERHRTRPRQRSP